MASDLTTKFENILVCRSDGCDTGPGYWAVPEPKKKVAKDGVEKAPRGKAQMLRLTDDDPRFLEWKVKLGILLKQELSPNPDGGLPWLVSFPRGYWLYEKSKHIWVSGYPTKARLYKTPQEFGLHLLWLLSSSEDPADCCCIHCNVPVVSDEDLLVKQKSVESPHSDLNSATTTTTTAAPLLSSGTTAAGLQKPTETADSASSSLATAHPIQAQASTHPQPQAAQPPQTTQQAAPPAQSTSAPPINPSSPQGFQNTTSLLYRTGELVWYEEGINWRLALILNSTPHNHTIIPVCHALFRRTPIVQTEAGIRPYQAFTLPALSIPEIQGSPFEKIDWTSYAQSTPFADEVLLDASKVAALKIDHSHSLFSKSGENKAQNTASFKGVFLGAERVEAGDVLRIRAKPATNNMTAISDSNDGAFLAVRAVWALEVHPWTLFFFGAAFRLVRGDQVPDESVPNDLLPQALREEIQWRNATFPNPQKWRCIRLCEPALFQENFIRGRFYPTHLLGPLIHGAAQFNALVAKGDLLASIPPLNSRLEPGKMRYPLVGRKANRRDTAAESIPPDTEFVLGAGVIENRSPGSETAPEES